MTGAQLLTDLWNRISDCTGGHQVMQFDTASQNKVYIKDGDTDKPYSVALV